MKPRLTKSLHILWRTFVVIMGIVPYVMISYFVIFWWIKNAQLPYSPPLNFKDVFKPIGLIMDLSILGSWAFWYLFCKLFKYVIVISGLYCDFD